MYGSLPVCAQGAESRVASLAARVEAVEAGAGARSLPACSLMDRFGAQLHCCTNIPCLVDALVVAAMHSTQVCIEYQRLLVVG